METNFASMKPNEIIDLWYDLSRPRNIWTQEGVVGWNPSQCSLSLLTTLENTLTDKLGINLFEVRVVLTCKKSAMDNAEHAAYKENQKKQCNKYTKFEKSQETNG